MMVCNSIWYLQQSKYALKSWKRIQNISTVLYAVSVTCWMKQSKVSWSYQFYFIFLTLFQFFNEVLVGGECFRIPVQTFLNTQKFMFHHLDFKRRSNANFTLRYKDVLTQTSVILKRKLTKKLNQID